MGTTKYWYSPLKQDQQRRTLSRESREQTDSQNMRQHWHHAPSHPRPMQMLPIVALEPDPDDDDDLDCISRGLITNGIFSFFTCGSCARKVRPPAGYTGIGYTGKPKSPSCFHDPLSEKNAPSPAKFLSSIHSEASPNT